LLILFGVCRTKAISVMAILRNQRDFGSKPRKTVHLGHQRGPDVVTIIPWVGDLLGLHPAQGGLIRWGAEF